MGGRMGGVEVGLMIWGGELRRRLGRVGGWE